MAVLLREENDRIYLSKRGIVTTKDKEKADRLDSELRRGVKRLERNFINKGLMSKSGRKNDALAVWFGLGSFLLKLAKKYKIWGSEEEVYYWRAVYGSMPPTIQKNPPPKDFKRLSSNQYRKAAIMAEYNWNKVRRVGSWALWNDLLDNPKILNDHRLLHWVVEKLARDERGHKEKRKSLYALSRRFNKIETDVLNDKELVERAEKFWQTLDGGLEKPKHD